MPMETAKVESPDISESERLLDQNWNERKRLIEQEWEIRSELQSSLQRNVSPDAFEEIRGRERELRATLARNADEYDAVIERWAAEVLRS